MSGPSKADMCSNGGDVGLPGSLSLGGGGPSCAGVSAPPARFASPFGTGMAAAVPSAAGAVASVHVYVNAPLPDSIPVISQNAHDRTTGTAHASMTRANLLFNAAIIQFNGAVVGPAYQSVAGWRTDSSVAWRLCQGRIAAERRHTAVLQSGLQHDLARLSASAGVDGALVSPSQPVSPPPAIWYLLAAHHHHAYGTNLPTGQRIFSVLRLAHQPTIAPH
jgi:hypothetical protein